MIKASGKVDVKGEPRQLLVAGLSRRNTERLLAGDPILFDGRQVGIDAMVLILGGETEDDMVEDLRCLGPIIEKASEL